MKVQELANVVRALKKKEESYLNVNIDLSDLRYIPSSEFDTLIDTSNFIKGIKFNKLSLKQFCRRIGVPIGFLNKVSSSLKTKIVNEMLEQIIDSDSKRAKLRLCKENDDLICRGIVNQSDANINDSFFLQSVVDVFKKDSVVQPLNLINSEQPTCIRVIDSTIFNKTVGSIFPASTVRSSDIGLTDIKYDVGMFVLKCKNGVVASYGEDSFYTHSYDGINTDILHDVSESMFNKMIKEYDILFNRVVSSRKKVLNLEESKLLITEYIDNRHIARSPGLKIKAAITQPENTYEDLSNTVTFTAQGYPINRRLDLEMSGGKLLGLDFER